MKKLTLIAPLVLAAPLTAYSADAMQNVKHSGFVDIVYVLSDGTDENLDPVGDSTIDKKWFTSGELDLQTDLNPSSQLRFDLDMSSFNTGLEQAFVNHALNKDMNLKAGIFNNIMGFEKEDAPDMYQTSHSQLWDIWDEQTAGIDGHNNVAGLLYSANVSMVTLYAGLLNDLQNTDEKVSFQLAANIRPMNTMDITAGMITADNGTPTDGKAGTIFDASMTWKMNQLMLGGEVLSADEIYDLGMQVTANYAFTDFFSGTARVDYVDYEANFDTSTSLTIGALFTVDKNLYANAEIRAMQNSDAAGTTTPNPMRKVGDGSVVLLEVIGTF